VVPGQRYYIAVTGATQDVFAVGAYHLAVSFAGDPVAVTAPAAAQGDPPPVVAPPVALGTVSSTSLGGLSLQTGSTVDGFVFNAARSGMYQVTAPGMAIRALDRMGQLVASGKGLVEIHSPGPHARFSVEIRSAEGTPVPDYSLSIGPRVTVTAAHPHRRSRIRDSGATRALDAEAACGRLIAPKVL
jgi:hypothetical protein